MRQINVVELKAKGAKNPTLPPVIQTIRHESKKELAALLQSLFDNVVDALFELADRSQSDQHQEMYFDSMRSIRIHRKLLATGFIERYNESFYTIFQVDNEQEESASIAEDELEFSLVEKEELEIRVAISGIVSKVTSRFSLQIMQLTKRIDSLAPHCEVTEKTNPLGPAELSTAFANSLEVVELNIRVRIILMKLFERFVMEQMGTIFENANAYL